MKIAIATNSGKRNAKVSPHFGRCHYFCIYDQETGKVKYIENEMKDQPQDAGIASAESLRDYGVNLVVAGRFGARSMRIFNANSIQMLIPEQETTIDSLINIFKQNK